jgi:hypothetical protein
VNVYWVDGGDAGWWSYGYEPPEPYRACGVFCADTPGQAKHDAVGHFNNDVEYREFRIRLLARDLDLPRGLFNEDCPEGPWDDDENIPPPEPWATVWSNLTRVLTR